MLWVWRVRNEILWNRCSYPNVSRNNDSGKRESHVFVGSKSYICAAFTAAQRCPFFLPAICIIYNQHFKVNILAIGIPEIHNKFNISTVLHTNLFKDRIHWALSIYQPLPDNMADRDTTMFRDEFDGTPIDLELYEEHISPSYWKLGKPPPQRIRAQLIMVYRRLPADQHWINRWPAAPERVREIAAQVGHFRLNQ